MTVLGSRNADRQETATERRTWDCVVRLGAVGFESSEGLGPTLHPPTLILE